MVLSLNLMKNINMTHKELIDQVSANLFKQSGKLESRRSWLAMRNYLEQLDSEQLKSMLKDQVLFKTLFLNYLFGFYFFLNSQKTVSCEANQKHIQVNMPSRKNLVY